MHVVYSTDQEYWDPSCATRLRKEHHDSATEVADCTACVFPKLGATVPSICYSCPPPVPSPVLPTRLQFELDGEISGAATTGAPPYTSPHAIESHIHFELTDETTGIGNPVSRGTLVQPYYEYEDITQQINDHHVETFVSWAGSRRPIQCDYVIDDTEYYVQGQVLNSHRADYSIAQQHNPDTRDDCPSPDEFNHGHLAWQYAYWQQGCPTSTTGDHYFKRTFRFPQRLRDWLAMRRNGATTTHYIMNPISSGGALSATIAGDGGILQTNYNLYGLFQGFWNQLRFYADATGNALPDEWGPGFSSYDSSGNTLWYLPNPNLTGGHVYGPDHPSYNSHPRMDHGWTLYYGQSGYIWRYSPQQKELRLYGYPPPSEYTYKCIRRGATAWNTFPDTGPVMDWVGRTSWPNATIASTWACPGHPPQTASTIHFQTHVVEERTHQSDLWPVIDGATQSQTANKNQWTAINLQMDESWDPWVVDPSPTNADTFRTWGHPDHYDSVGQYYDYCNPVIDKEFRVAYFWTPNIGPGCQAGFWDHVRDRSGWHLATYAVDQNCGTSPCGDWELNLTYRWNSGAVDPAWWPTDFPETGRIKF